MSKFTSSTGNNIEVYKDSVNPNDYPVDIRIGRSKLDSQVICFTLEQGFEVAQMILDHCNQVQKERSYIPKTRKGTVVEIPNGDRYIVTDPDTATSGRFFTFATNGGTRAFSVVNGVDNGYKVVLY